MRLVAPVFLCLKIVLFRLTWLPRATSHQFPNVISEARVNSVLWTVDRAVGELALSGEALLAKARAQLERKAAEEEMRWLQRCQEADWRDRLGQWVDSEADERIRIWARVRLAGERCTTVARELGYRDGSGVGQVVRRLERRSAEDADLRKNPAEIKANLSRVLG